MPREQGIGADGDREDSTPAAESGLATSGLATRIRRSRAKRYVLPAVMLSMLGASAAPAAPVAAAVPPSMRESIVQVAQREYHDTSRNFELRGSDNCTFYSGEVTGWPLCGPAGWRGGSKVKDRDYAWCANFAKYVWRESGAEHLRRVDAWAYSFAKYGAANGTLHLAGSGYVPRPGDAVVFDWEQPYIDLSTVEAMTHKVARDIDHVGIAVSFVDGRLVTIEGNADNRILERKYSISDATIRAYISPVGADSPPVEAHRGRR